MPRRQFAQVDVFTTRPFRGNPLAVVLDADGLGTADMQRIARWTNLSETAFVVSPTVAGADYQARIFAQQEELPFAGHPALGTAHAVVEAGRVSPRNGRLGMQCLAGVVELSVRDGGLAFRLPRYATWASVGAEHLSQVLGGVRVLGSTETIDTGPHWLVARVEDVVSLKPEAAGLRAMIDANRTSGLTVYSETRPGEIAVRTFFFTDRMAEDPICGSGNAAVAVHRVRAGAIRNGDAYLARQGQQIDRDGEVLVRIEAGDIHVGGPCVTCIRGDIEVPGPPT